MRSLRTSIGEEKYRTFGPRLHRRTQHDISGSGRGSCWRSAGMECRHRQEVWTHMIQHHELGTNAGYGRRPRIQRRHERSHVPRVRCQKRKALMGISDEFRHHGQRIFYVDGNSISPCSRLGVIRRSTGCFKPRASRRIFRSTSGGAVWARDQ